MLVGSTLGVNDGMLLGVDEGWRVGNLLGILLLLGTLVGKMLGVIDGAATHFVVFSKSWNCLLGTSKLEISVLSTSPCTTNKTPDHLSVLPFATKVALFPSAVPS
jgi:hypothetical protein